MVDVKRLKDEELEQVNGGNEIPNGCQQYESGACLSCSHYHVNSVQGTLNYTERISCDLNLFQTYDYEYKRRY